jgi:predicted tellurium resistance membrane protein TerC
VEWLTDPDIWIGFLTLLGLEVVLGIDNVVFISILAGKLPPPSRPEHARSASASPSACVSCCC